MAASIKKIVVVTSVLPDEIQYSKDGNGDSIPIISDTESRLDALDNFNHPRIRRVHILRAFEQKYADSMVFVKPPDPPQATATLDLVESYRGTQSTGLLTFFATAWKQWSDLGDAGRDPMASLKTKSPEKDKATPKESDLENTINTKNVPALVPGNVSLSRDPHQRPSKNVMGQIGYYCTDTCTPVFGALLSELSWDAATIHHALDLLLSTPTECSNTSNKVVYALPTHPGHHAARDSFGGYCYLNQAAHAAQLFLDSGKMKKVAVLDVDYHCGNGTASIFYDNPNVLVVSIHCHPDHDYPFHSGFSEENDEAEALCHLPLLPGAAWEPQYRSALEQGMQAIQEFGAEALVVSLGLDTLGGDPVTLRRAGFDLKKSPDYWEMGKLIGSSVDKDMPCLFVQEGGYKMDDLGEAAADVVAAFASER